MVFQIIKENGQKKIVPLTADVGAGNPVGSYLYLEKKSNPQGYLYCDGSTFDETKYPLLYAYLGSNVLPDWRELGAKGAEKNTTLIFDSTETNPSTGQAGTQNHDVFAQGEFKDDQLQAHQHYSSTALVDDTGSSQALKGIGNYTSQSQLHAISSDNTGRKGTVTRGKSRAVFIYIKATSGLSENAQDNVINTLNEQRSYSTEEHLTGRKWIDGKPTYEKTLTGNVTANITSETDVATLNIADIPNVVGAVKTGGNIIPFGYGTSSADKVICFYNSTTGKFSVQSAYAGSFYVTLEYTKTTD